MSTVKHMTATAFIVLASIALAFFAGFNAGIHHAIEDAYVCVEDVEVVIDLDGNEYIHVIE